MARLRDLAQLIRTKNAGPFQLTIDILFEDEPTYRRVKDSGVITRELVAERYRLPLENVRLFHYDPAYAIKISMPRPVASGDLGDTDVFGGQQLAPLVDLEIPEAAARGEDG